MLDFIRPQIKEGYRLAIPEGLEDLMSDISREVLRAQPQNLYQFIADYLAALMVARENLSIASHLCDSVCTGACNPELEDELRYIGLDEYDAEISKKIIVDHFQKEQVNEQSLMIKIANKTSIDGSLLPALQEAIRKAFKRNLINNTTIYQSSSDSEDDEIARAAKHTLHLYRKTKHTQEEYQQAAVKVQAAYQAFGVRRFIPPGEEKPQKEQKLPPKNLKFNDTDTENSKSAPFKACMPSVSSTSLAGSYLNLPKYVPYTAHEPDFTENDELTETESTNVFYTNTDEYPSCSGQKRISFQDTPQKIVEDMANLADDESDTSVKEMLVTQKNITHNDEGIAHSNQLINTRESVCNDEKETDKTAQNIVSDDEKLSNFNVVYGDEKAINIRESVVNYDEHACEDFGEDDYVNEGEYFEQDNYDDEENDDDVGNDDVTDDISTLALQGKLRQL